MSRANQDVFLTTEELAQRWRTTSANVHMRRHRGEAPPAWRRGKSLIGRAHV